MMMVVTGGVSNRDSMNLTRPTYVRQNHALYQHAGPGDSGSKSSVCRVCQMRYACVNR